MQTILKNKAKHITVILIFVFTNFAQSQTLRPQGPPPIPNAEQTKQMLSDLKTSLSLNAEQSEKIAALFNEHFKKVGQILEAEKARMEKTRAEMDKLRNSFEANVKSLLTEEQQKQFEAFTREHDPGKEREKKPIQ